MMVSFDVGAFKVTPNVAQGFHWLAFDDSSRDQGIYLNMQFEDASEIDKIVKQLEALKDMMVNADGKETIA